jgi:hypothetical protein
MKDFSKASGPNREREEYASGMLADQRPDLPVSPDELREEAMDALSEEDLACVAGSAGGEDGVREVVKSLLPDLYRTLALTGQYAIADMDESVLVKTN